MVKWVSIVGLFLILAGCSTAGVAPQGQLAVIETWAGHAVGKGSECSDAEVNVNVLEDLSIVGTALATEQNMVIQLKGKLDSNRDFVASGSGIGGVSVTYKGSIKGDSASGTWDSSMVGCGGTWKLAKISP